MLEPETINEGKSTPGLLRAPATVILVALLLLAHLATAAGRAATWLFDAFGDQVDHELVERAMRATRAADLPCLY